MMDWEDQYDKHLLFNHKLLKPFWQCSDSKHCFSGIKDNSYELFEFLNQDEGLQFQNILLSLALELADKLNVELQIE